MSFSIYLIEMSIRSYEQSTAVKLKPKHDETHETTTKNNNQLYVVSDYLVLPSQTHTCSYCHRVVSHLFAYFSIIVLFCIVCCSIRFLCQSIVYAWRSYYSPSNSFFIEFHFFSLFVFHFIHTTHMIIVRCHLRTLYPLTITATTKTYSNETWQELWMKKSKRIENEMVFSSVHTMNQHIAFGIFYWNNNNNIYTIHKT